MEHIDGKDYRSVELVGGTRTFIARGKITPDLSSLTSSATFFFL